MQTTSRLARSLARRMPRVLVVPLLALALGLALAAPCFADAIDDALARDAQGARDDARSRLEAIVNRQGTTALDLGRIARVAAGWQDQGLLDALRGRIEPLVAAAPEDAALLVAEVFTYLGMAETAIASGTAGSNVAFLFSDVDQIATRTLAREDLDPELRAWMRAAAARSRYDQGDLSGALARLAPASRPTEIDEHPAVLVLRGLYMYAQALKLPRDENGYPGPEARKAFEGAGTVLARVFDEDAPEDPAQAWRAALNGAWAWHRIGALDRAAKAYARAYEWVGADADGKRRGQLLRGLQILYTRHPEHFQKQLEALRLDHASDLPLIDALVRHHAKGKRYAPALELGAIRLELAPQDMASWQLVGSVLEQMGQIDEAAKHYGKAIALDPTDVDAAFRLEALARNQLGKDFDRGLALYEQLLALRPQDPYARNNLGFVLRDWVTPYTQMDRRTGIQVIREDAPAVVRERLERCRDVYAEAVALIPESEDGTREFDVAWNLAGIINDYGLMIHYFQDIQDPRRAEQMYMRALRMTEDGFKDTYAPNLQRLYAFVLPHRELAWYRLARRCKDKILKEVRKEDGSVTFVDDEAKQQVAARDEARLRARLLEELGADAPNTPDSAPQKDGSGDDR